MRFLDQKIMKLVSAVILGLIWSLKPDSLHAFKIDTHVYVAQQVLNDALDDGHLTIEPFGEFKIPQKHLAALAAFPDEFRMGSIGPDGFPDLVGGQMTVHPGLEGGWKSDDWLKWLLESAATEKQLSFSLGYMTHAAADVFSHTYVNLYSGDFFNLLDDQETEIRHTALEEYIKNHTPPILDNQNNIITPYVDINAPASFIRDTLILNPTVAEQYRLQVGTRYLSFMYDYWEKIGLAIRKVDELKNLTNQEISKVQSKITTLENRIKSLKDLTVSVWGVTVKIYPYYCVVDPGTCALVLSTVAALKAENKVLDALKSLNAEASSLLQRPLEAWRNEVAEAVRQYVITSQNIAGEIMKEDGAALQELEKWLCEWGPVFAAIPNEATLPVCSTVSGVARAKKIHDDIHSGFADYIQRLTNNELLTFVLVSLTDPYQATQIFKDQIKEEFKGLAMTLADEMLGPDSLALDVLRLRLEKRTDQNMIDIFSRSNTEDLINIGDLPGRVKADMHLIGNQFDPQSFNVIYNSVLLSKLAILDASQLNKLVKIAGVDHTIYGEDLYDPRSFVNILVDAIASLDGNHQWQEYPLPYPRESGTGVPIDTMLNPVSFGYPFADNTGKGFRLWQDCEVRSQVFSQIFKGPIAPALETPSEFGLQAIAGYNNPTSVSVSNPYPVSTNSSLKFKALTDDPRFDPDNWMDRFDISRFLSTDGAYVSLDSKTPNDLPNSSYGLLRDLLNPKNLVFDLKAQACGGSLAHGNSGNISARWAFLNGTGCTYTCSCVKPQSCRFINMVWTCIEADKASCVCSSPECGVFPRRLTSIYDAYEFGLSAADNQQCGACHNGPEPFGNMNVGTWLFKSKFAPGLEVGKGIEYEGSLICDATATQTKLVMKAVDAKNIYMQVTDDQTGSTSVANTVKETNETAFTNVYTDWRDVDAAIKNATNQKEGACGVVRVADAATFEQDILAPVLKVKQDLSISCEQLRAYELSGMSVLDIIGVAEAIDNRESDVQVENDAPVKLALGKSTITWTASDSSNNTQFSTQVVTVTDLEPPVFSSDPLPITVAATNSLGTTVSIDPPVATDGCDGEIVATTTTDFSSLPIGSNVVVWKVTDQSGNQSEVLQEITVKAKTGDLDINGIVDAEDVGIFISDLDNLVIQNPIEVDYTNDGVINEEDQLVRNHIITTELENMDLNGDDLINELDVRIMFSSLDANADLDLDNDQILDSYDNCISKYNPDQIDVDDDGIGRACDFDGDNLPPVSDNSGSGDGSSGEDGSGGSFFSSLNVWQLCVFLVLTGCRFFPSLIRTSNYRT